MLKRKYFLDLTDEELKSMLYRLHITEEKSINMISKDMGVARDTLNRWFNYFGIPRRNQSQSMKVRHKHLTPEERKQLASKAHDAIRGSSRGLAEKVARATSVSNGARMTSAEKEFAKILIDHDFYDFIFSYPIAIFNIDFAFPAHKVAIEVDGGNWHSTERKQAQDLKKEEFLTSEGWTVLRWSTAPHLTSELPALIARLNQLLT